MTKIWRGKMRLLVEHVKRYKIDGYAIRIWSRGEPPREVLIRKLRKTDASMERWAKDILSRVSANAIEVTHRGEGVVVYVDWP
jgi:hypothetical protein